MFPETRVKSPKIYAEADPGFFLEGGALVSCSTSTPINHIVFFLQNTSCIRKPQVISWGGANPVHSLPRSAPVMVVVGEMLSGVIHREIKACCGSILSFRIKLNYNIYRVSQKFVPLLYKSVIQYK